MTIRHDYHSPCCSASPARIYWRVHPRLVRPSLPPTTVSRKSIKLEISSCDNEPNLEIRRMETGRRLILNHDSGEDDSKLIRFRDVNLDPWRKDFCCADNLLSIQGYIRAWNLIGCGRAWKTFSICSKLFFLIQQELKREKLRLKIHAHWICNWNLFWDSQWRSPLILCSLDNSGESRRWHFWQIQ